MKIAFLNPWSDCAENQAFQSLRIAAQRLGHEVVHCSNSEQIEHAGPDFVLASASTQPKLADVPHYGCIHEPRDRFLNHRKYFENLLTYDGFLTISDRLEKFLLDVNCGAGRTLPIGFFYDTAQRQETSAGLDSLIPAGALRITYFGTNWDFRRKSFFEDFSALDGVQICGPPASWQHIHQRSYGGELPFDGLSVQQRYAENGIGLCMLSEQHLRDDIVSNRIFEIASSGAIAFCCDTPWIRKHFGDSVYYFDQDLPDDALCRAILKLRDQVYAQPQIAIEKAQQARHIFESKFAAEIMLQNAIDYHSAISASRTSALRAAEQQYRPFISVIVRCGSRPVDYVQRAVRSISGQTYGEFEVILVRFRDIDLDPVVQSSHPRIRSFQVIDCPGGNRSATAWAGLNAIHGEYFAVLDDDDWWFSNHFETLFRPWPRAPQERFFAYSGIVVERSQPQILGPRTEDKRDIRLFPARSRESLYDITRAFGMCNFVSSTDLLDDELRIDPGMETAEDSYLVYSLFAQTEPVFSFAATAVLERGLHDHSGGLNHTPRYEDELTLQLRLFGKRRPAYLTGDAWQELSDYWSRRPAPAFPGSDPQSWLAVASGFDPKKSVLAAGSSFSDHKSGKARVCSPQPPWAYAVELVVNKPSRGYIRYILAAEVAVTKGVIGIGLLNPTGSDYVFRKSLPASPEAHKVEIPITDLSKTGKLILQNWDTYGQSEAELLFVRLLAEK